jgi:hypothetical protein
MKFHQEGKIEQNDLIFLYFVSPTFSYLKAERDALQLNVLPWLQEYCQKHGCRVQAIDLRFLLRP